MWACLGFICIPSGGSLISNICLFSFVFVSGFASIIIDISRSFIVTKLSEVFWKVIRPAYFSFKKTLPKDELKENKFSNPTLLHKSKFVNLFFKLYCLSSLDSILWYRPDNGLFDVLNKGSDNL